MKMYPRITASTTAMAMTTPKMYSAGSSFIDAAFTSMKTSSLQTEVR